MCEFKTKKLIKDRNHAIFMANNYHTFIEYDLYLGSDMIVPRNPGNFLFLFFS